MVYPFTSKLLVIDMQKKRQKLTSGGAQKFAKIKDTNYLYQRLINRHIAYYAKEKKRNYLHRLLTSGVAVGTDKEEQS